MKKLLLIFFIAFGLIGSSWALQVSPTAIAFACENTGLVVEEVQYLREDGRLCGESYNPIPESKEEAESQAKECPISIPVVNLISSEDKRCIEAEKKISSGKIFRSKEITFQTECITNDDGSQICRDIKTETHSFSEPYYFEIEKPTIPSSYELTVNPTIGESNIYVERPIEILICGDLIIPTETPDISSNNEIVTKTPDITSNDVLVIDVPVYIELESDDPRCIEAKKNND